jgi:hypothetical protein
MTDNPFQPPTATLDVPPTVGRQRGPPPPSVRYAVKALYASAALLVPFILALAIGIPLPGGASTFFDVATNLFTLAFLMFFAAKISKARNWARWTYGIVTALGSAAFYYSWIAFPDLWFTAPLLLRAFSWVQDVLQVSAAVMLFVPTSNAWFAPIDAA